MLAAAEREKIQQIQNHFRKKDGALFEILAKMEIELLRPEENTELYFPKLCREIISQQLGGKAARAIVGRFTKLFPEECPAPAEVLGFSEDALRAVGMSWAKARSIRDLASKTYAGEVRFSEFPAMADEAVVAELVKVRGIGRWTAEMFLMFTLGREDVFSSGDLGLRKGMERIYGKRRMQTAKNIERIVAEWTPYQTYGSLALWHVHDASQQAKMTK